jgi:1,4-alpha-glucan branching enzyme
MTIAEESTAFPGVSRPVHDGGLGFGFKWNMGWMNDTLEYIGKTRSPQTPPRQDDLRPALRLQENFILPISHDEVVHGKGSMYSACPGTRWERLANLRAYYGFMWGHPGKKLLFMGCEFAQPGEWAQGGELDWDEAQRARPGRHGAPGARPEHALPRRAAAALPGLRGQRASSGCA